MGESIRSCNPEVSSKGVPIAHERNLSIAELSGYTLGECNPESPPFKLIERALSIANLMSATLDESSLLRSLKS